MTERRHPNVVNIDEVETRERLQGTKFGAHSAPLGSLTGGRGVGCNLFAVPVGRAAMPFHWHGAMEEVIFIISGAGTLRIGADRVAVRAGDYITFPTGPDHAHQLINTGDAVLRYLCLSDKHPAEVVGYPDSGKIAALSSAPGAKWGDPAWAQHWFPADAAVDYFHGEEVD